MNERALSALLRRPGPVLVWGVSPVALRFLAEVRRLGLTDLVAGVVDHRPAHEGLQVSEWTVVGPSRQVVWDVAYLVVGLDAEKEGVLRRFVAQTGAKPEIFMYGRAHYEFQDPLFWELVNRSYAQPRTGGYRDVLVHLFQSLRHIVDRRLPGDVVEFGVYKGGTTILMAEFLRRAGSSATVFGFDTFDGFPPRRSALDTYTCADDECRDLEVVQANCRLHSNIRLVVGDIAETYRELSGRQLALTFFDMDNYSAARAALPLCAELTVSGGVIAFDHYYSPDWPYPIGERMAAEEVLDGPEWFNLHATGIFLKVGA